MASLLDIAKVKHTAAQLRKAGRPEDALLLMDMAYAERARERAAAETLTQQLFEASQPPATGEGEGKAGPGVETPAQPLSQGPQTPKRAEPLIKVDAWEDLVERSTQLAEMADKCRRRCTPQHSSELATAVLADIFRQVRDEVVSTSEMLSEVQKDHDAWWGLESEQAHTEMPSTIGRRLDVMCKELSDLKYIVEILRLPREESLQRGIELPSGTVSRSSPMSVLDTITAKLGTQAESVLGLMKTYCLFVFQEAWSTSE